MDYNPQPAKGGSPFQTGNQIVGQRYMLYGRSKDEVGGLKDERFIPFHHHLPHEILYSVFTCRIYIRVVAVLKDAKSARKAKINVAGAQSDGKIRERVNLDLAAFKML